MKFSVGDKVVHPGIGAGKIIGTREQELVGGFENYYVVEIPTRGSTVYVPVRTADELGLRAAMSQERYNRVVEVLGGTPEPLPDEYKQRQGQVEERLKTGQPVVIAETVRDLTWRGETAYLTKKDGDLLMRGRELLVGEMALAAGTGIEETTQVIDKALMAAVEADGDGGGE